MICTNERGYRWPDSAMYPCHIAGPLLPPGEEEASLRDRETVQWLYYHSRDQLVSLLVVIAGNSVLALGGVSPGPNFPAHY